MPDSALLLDVDGTLLDIAATPDSVVVPAGLPETLERLRSALGGALALISGRAIADLDRIFDPLRLPAAGQHGAEIRTGVATELMDGAERGALEIVVARLREFAAARPGLLIEDKGMSVATHYRGAPRYRDELRTFLAALLAEIGPSLQLLEARMAFDVKPSSINKGLAVNRLMRRPPFRGRTPIYAGDDRTDEDGFAAARALSGEAIRVGADGETIATWRIESPARFRQWLHDGAKEIGA